MITAVEIRKKTERKYVDYLRSVVAGSEFELIVIPCDKKASASMDEYQRELTDIRSQSKEVKGFGYTIEWKTVKTKTLGEQDLPERVLFESASDIERFLQKCGEVSQFRKDVAMLLDEFPQLRSWVERYPLKVVENASFWSDLLKVLRYFVVNPCPRLYIRELPIEVHTKFIECNKGVLRELLDIVIVEHVCSDEKVFEKRFGLRYDESWVRIRVLEASIANEYFAGVDDLTMPQSQFCALSLPVQKVFVVENKINFLTFPKLAGSLLIWGHGFTIGILKSVPFMRHASLYYWGDIDAQGFEILSQFRSYFPQTQSLLMDRTTFDTYFEGDKGTPSNVSKPLHLTPAEAALYDHVKFHNLRLEQEKIPQKCINNIFNSLLKNGQVISEV
jgi:hypothetical protein